MWQNDKFMVEEIRKGNLDAFKLIFDHYFPELCNYCNMYLHNSSFAEEVVLDIFTGIWENRKSFLVNSTLKGYLYIAVKNRSISRCRKERKYLFDQLDINTDVEPVDHSSQLYLENKELRLFIEQAIQELPEKTRQVYLMAREEHLSHKEIAKRLGISSKTVENHVGIALRKLRISLRPYYNYLYFLIVSFFIS